MKKGISLQISAEFNYDPDKVDETLLSNIFPKVSRALEAEGWTVDNIELFDV